MNHLHFCPTDRANNFPPLPKFIRIKPCFYQNVDEEIPQPYQQLVRRVYNLWMCEYRNVAFTVKSSISDFLKFEWSI